MKSGKKIQLVILAIICFNLMIFTEESNKPFKRKVFTFTIKGDFLSSSDPNYNDLYGSKKYSPEGEIEIRFSGNLYLWTSYCQFVGKRDRWEWSSKALPEPDFQWEIESKKHLTSLGLGYFVGLSDPGELNIAIELGISFITNNEVEDKYQIASQQKSDSNRDSAKHIAVIGNLGVRYFLWKNLFAEISAGYIYGTTTVDEEREQIGGVKIGLGLGIRL